MGKTIKQLKAARQKIRAKARGMTVSELEAYEYEKRIAEKQEKAKYLTGKARRDAKAKYDRKRKQDKEHGPGWRGTLARVQAHGTKLGEGHRILVGAGDTRKRPTLEELVWGKKRKRRR